ncbi:MAG: ABC transporter ATP-binding protein [Butyrivibrio sp.]|nr:ABC transporter ATP-binding protein [Butyrivibrio sp.]
MIEVKDLSFSYGKKEALILDGVNFTLQNGEIGILMGKNGAGKTTLFKTMLGILKPGKGSIIFDGEDITRLGLQEKAKKIAYVPQHIHFGDLSVYDSILTGRIAYFGFRVSSKDTEVVDEIIDEMKLGGFAHRNAEQLSGGREAKGCNSKSAGSDPADAHI